MAVGGTCVLRGCVPVDGSERAVLSASHEVEIGVLGESEFLNLLGVPSLLLLPGFLLLITWRMLQSMLAASGAEGFRLKPKEADFWAVAIALSLCFSFAYPWLTETLLPEGRRDYLVAYGLQDLVYVYTAAIVLGLLCFIGGRLVVHVVECIAAARLERSGHEPPIPGWKRMEVFRDALPERDLAALAEDEG